MVGEVEEEAKGVALYLRKLPVHENAGCSPGVKSICTVGVHIEADVL